MRYLLAAALASATLVSTAQADLIDRVCTSKYNRAHHMCGTEFSPNYPQCLAEAGRKYRKCLRGFNKRPIEGLNQVRPATRIPGRIRLTN